MAGLVIVRLQLKYICYSILRDSEYTIRAFNEAIIAAAYSDGYTGSVCLFYKTVVSFFYECS